MKFKFVIASSLLALAMSVGAGFSISNKKEHVEIVNADVGDYYDTISGSGYSLLESINGVISENYHSVGYDGLKAAYATVDLRADGYLYDIYSDYTTYTPGSNFGSGTTEVGKGYNREHTIPQSWWGGSTDQQGCDLFIVLPSDVKANSERSNFPYGYTNSGTQVKMADDPSGNRKGASSKEEYVSGTVFEPFDNRKGDLARIYFYAVARYLKGGAKNGAVTKWTSDYGSAVFKSDGNNGFVQKYLDMLLKWHKDDPVSDWEITRNERVKGIQGNRNPFIDHPSWVDIIWGGTYPSTGANYENTNGGTASVVNGQISGGTPVVSLSVSPSSSSISVGNSVTLTATASGGSGNVTWSKTSGSSYVSFSATSGNSISVTGSAAGTATVQASYSGKTATATITVTPVLSSIAVQTAPTKTTYTAGEKFDPTGLVITRNFQGGSSDTYTYADHSSEFSFTPSTSTNLTTSNTSVTITYGGKSASQAITVNESSASSFTIDFRSNGNCSSTSGSFTYVSFSMSTNSSNNPPIYHNDGEIRMYYASDGSGNSLTLTPSANYRITSVILTASSETYTPSVKYNVDGGNDISGTWSSSIMTISNISASSSFVFRNANTSSKQLRIKTIEVSYSNSSSPVDPVVTSISASVSKTYYVGDTISASDITVKDNLNNNIADFTFANDDYQFKFEDASSGGSLTDKIFTNSISYSTFTCSLTVQVQRKARQSTESSTKSVNFTDLPTSYQTGTDERTAASGIKFIAYNLANFSSKMQFKEKGGYFQTTQSMNLKSLQINNRETNALTVYASNSSGSFTQTITGSNDVYNLTGYTYVKVMKSGNGAAYCASLTLSIGVDDSAVNLANYIMYEDTNNQCATKFPTAKGYFEGLTSTERSTFMTSNDYVIKEARKRLQAWADHLGKTITYSNSDYVISNSSSVLPIKEESSVSIITIISLIGVASVGGYFYVRKRKTY